MLDKTDGRILAGDWTEIRVEELKRMWAEGSTAAEIAGELGNVTRNAVLGKIHRLGIAHTAPKSKRALTADRPRRRAGWRPVIWTPPMSPEERARRKADRELARIVARPQPIHHDYLNITFEQLEYGNCRFPIGDDPPFLFCGQPIFRDSYCAHCFRVTHAPTSRREAA